MENIVSRGNRTLSVHQEHELLVALEKAGLDKEDAQTIIQSPGNELAIKVVTFIRSGGIETPVTEDEKKAILILGKARVITLGEVSQKWTLKPFLSPSVFPSEGTLRQCAEENRIGKADWRLVYVLGLSPQKQWEIREINHSNPPRFSNDATHWLSKRESNWANQEILSGYRLLNFKLQFTNMSWQKQEEAIVKLGKEYERAEEQAVAEALFSIFMTRLERLLPITYHWGRMGYLGNHIIVGCFDERGLRFYCYTSAVPHSSQIGVVVSLKF